VSYLLVIDIGNTNIKLGIWNNEAWQFTWRIRTIPEKTADEFAGLLRNLLYQGALNYKGIKGVAISSVVPALTITFTDLVRRYIGVEPVIASAYLKTGIRIGVENLDMVGADRVVNAAAVYKLFGGPTILIDFGTATKFEAITRDGEYMGGSIAPGIGISMEALAGRTARLFRVPLEPPPSPIGRNSAHAIQSGLFWGYVGLIEGLVTRIRSAMPEGDAAKVIATGGLSSLFQQHTVVFQEIAPLLTLDGLQFIYELNS
jgi:type III pantothenate kinase